MPITIPQQIILPILECKTLSGGTVPYSHIPIIPDLVGYTRHRKLGYVSEEFDPNIIELHLTEVWAKTVGDDVYILPFEQSSKIITITDGECPFLYKWMTGHSVMEQVDTGKPILASTENTQFALAYETVLRSQGLDSSGAVLALPTMDCLDMIDDLIKYEYSNTLYDGIPDLYIPADHNPSITKIITRNIVASFRVSILGAAGAYQEASDRVVRLQAVYDSAPDDDKPWRLLQLNNATAYLSIFQ